MSAARQRLNRLFVVAVVCWTIYCLFVQPILMAREGQAHFEAHNKFCYEIYSSVETEKLQGCLNDALSERTKGMYTGFGVEYDLGHGFSYGWYYRVMWRILAIEIIAPPAVLYLLLWGTVRVSLWNMARIERQG